jgi:hypothetical protein
MSDYAAVRTAVTEYARDYIAALKRRGESYAEIGKRLRCSHVWVMQLAQPEKYGDRNAGADVEHRLAELLHGGSIDALRRAALHLAAGGTVTNEDEGGVIEIGPRVLRVADSKRPRSGPKTK